METTEIQKTSRLGVATKAIVLLAFIAAIGYGIHAHRQVAKLTADNQTSNAALAATRNQIDSLNQKIDSLQPAQQVTVTAPQKTQKPSPVHTASTRATSRVAAHRRSDDPRWKQIQSQLAENRKAIDDTREELSNTRNELAGTRTDLQGSIARTHSELVALQKKGERNYYEFDISKSGQFHNNGALGIRLKKANTKHQFADLELMVDDVKLSKKHINLYEPAFFYPTGSQQSTELVINSITKDHIHGYVSQPKYKPADLAAMSDAGNATASASQPQAKQPQPRQRLSLPQ